MNKMVSFNSKIFFTILGLSHFVLGESLYASSACLPKNEEAEIGSITQVLNKQSDDALKQSIADISPEKITLELSKLPYDTWPGPFPYAENTDPRELKILRRLESDKHRDELFYIDAVHHDYLTKLKDRLTNLAKTYKNQKEVAVAMAKLFAIDTADNHRFKYMHFPKGYDFYNLEIMKDLRNYLKGIHAEMNIDIIHAIEMTHAGSLEPWKVIFEILKQPSVQKTNVSFEYKSDIDGFSRGKQSFWKEMSHSLKEDLGTASPETKLEAAKMIAAAAAQDISFAELIPAWKAFDPTLSDQEILKMMHQLSLTSPDYDPQPLIEALSNPIQLNDGELSQLQSMNSRNGTASTALLLSETNPHLNDLSFWLKLSDQTSGWSMDPDHNAELIHQHIFSLVKNGTGYNLDDDGQTIEAYKRLHFGKINMSLPNALALREFLALNHYRITGDDSLLQDIFKNYSLEVKTATAYRQYRHETSEDLANNTALKTLTLRVAKLLSEAQKLRPDLKMTIDPELREEIANYLNLRWEYSKHGIFDDPSFDSTLMEGWLALKDGVDQAKQRIAYADRQNVNPKSKDSQILGWFFIAAAHDHTRETLDRALKELNGKDVSSLSKASSAIAVAESNVDMGRKDRLENILMAIEEQSSDANDHATSLYMDALDKTLARAGSLTKDEEKLIQKHTKILIPLLRKSWTNLTWHPNEVGFAKLAIQTLGRLGPNAADSLRLLTFCANSSNSLTDSARDAVYRVSGKKL